MASSLAVPPTSQLLKTCSTPVEGLPRLVPVLQRAKSDGRDLFSRRLANGEQRFTDALLRKLIDDDARSHVSFAASGVEADEDHDDRSEDVPDWASILGECVGAAVPAALPDAAAAEADVVVAPPWKCGICLEERPTTEPAVPALCGRARCVSFCSECVGAYCQAAAEGSKFMALPVRCPAPRCGRRVPTARWAQHVPDSHHTMYQEGARSILNYRCPNCHEPSSLFIPTLSPLEREDKLRELLRSVAPEHEQEMRRHWSGFAAGIVRADTVLDSILTALGLRADQLFPPPYDEDGEKVSAPFPAVLELINDIERRCVLHLAALRRQPKIYTPCCGTPLCWKCKIEGHHESETCEELQRGVLNVRVQFCPSCGVGTEKTEGCNHIVCLCGEDWEWKEDDEDDEGSEE